MSARYMRFELAPQYVCSLWFVLLLACCTDEKPATFMDRCELDAGECQTPFECVPVKRHENDADPRSICTKPCAKTEECPGWYMDEGHCKGEFHSLCEFGYCQGWCS